MINLMILIFAIIMQIKVLMLVLEESRYYDTLFHVYLNLLMHILNKINVEKKDTYNGTQI